MSYFIDGCLKRWDKQQQNEIIDSMKQQQTLLINKIGIIINFTLS